MTLGYKHPDIQQIFGQSVIKCLWTLMLMFTPVEGSTV
jgi:hypothetical protein